MRAWPMIGLLALLMLAPALAAADRCSVGAFSFRPEKGWELHTRQVRDALLVAYAPSVDEKFRPYIDVQVEDLGKAVLPQMYFNVNRQEILKLKSAQVYTQTSLLIGGRPAGRLVWSAQMGDRVLKFHTTLIVYHGKGYVITGIAPIEEYAKYALSFERMADSTRIGP